MSSLFDSIDEQKRDRLRELGWKRIVYHGGVIWKSPEGGHFLEAEAFRQLEAMEREVKS